MARVLTEYLQRTIRDPFVWGECDCALWAAGAVEYISGFDPAAHLRGRYSTAREMLTILKNADGLFHLVGDNMGGFVSGERRDGIAVIRGGRREYCGLLIGGTFWVKFDGGVGTIPNPEILDGWNLCLKH